jgi:hypothetical protein
MTFKNRRQSMNIRPPEHRHVLHQDNVIYILFLANSLLYLFWDLSHRATLQQNAAATFRGLLAVFRIRINRVRIQIQHFRVNTDPDPDPIQVGF